MYLISTEPFVFEYSEKNPKPVFYKRVLNKQNHYNIVKWSASN